MPPHTPRTTRLPESGVSSGPEAGGPEAGGPEAGGPEAGGPEAGGPEAGGPESGDMAVPIAGRLPRRAVQTPDQTAGPSSTASSTSASGSMMRW